LKGCGFAFDADDFDIGTEPVCSVGGLLFLYTHGHHLHAQPLISQRRAFIGAGLFALKNKRRFLQQPNILLYWKLRD